MWIKEVGVADERQHEENRLENNKEYMLGTSKSSAS